MTYKSKFGKLGETAIRLNGIVQLASKAFNTINSTLQSCVEANQAQQEAEAKLAQVMRNTMDASDAQRA